MKNIRTNKKRVVVEGNRAKIWGGRFYIDICLTKYPENLNDLADVLQEGLDLVHSAGEDTGDLEVPGKKDGKEVKEIFRV